MHRFLDWPPIFWTLRISILVVLAGGLHVFVLLISRFFRWTNIRSMVLAEPPRVESVGGEFAGAKAEVKLFQEAEARQESSLDQRLSEVEGRIVMLLRALGLEDERRGWDDE